VENHLAAATAATPTGELPTPVATPVGGMTLRVYLPTRAFELTVHGLDLVRALTGRGQLPPGFSVL